MSDTTNVSTPSPEVYPDGKPITIQDLIAASQPNAAVEYKRVQVHGFLAGKVFVIRSVTSGAIIEWSEASEGEAKRTAGLRLIIDSVVDGEPGKDSGARGAQLMDSSAIGLLRKIPHKVTETVVKEIIKLNGLSIKADSDAKKE